MLLVLALCLWSAAAFAHFAPATPAGRACRSWAVERPAAWLTRLTPAGLAAGALFMLALFALAPILPFDALVLAAGDLTAYLEVLGAVTLLAIRSRGVRVTVRDLVRRVFRTPDRAERPVRTAGREIRPPPRRSRSPKAVEDDRQAAGTPAFA